MLNNVTFGNIVVVVVVVVVVVDVVVVVVVELANKRNKLEYLFMQDVAIDITY